MTVKNILKTNKNTLVTLIFLIFLGSLALISEFFQNPNSEIVDANLYKNPLGDGFLKELHRIHFINRLINVTVEKKKGLDQLEHWHLTGPRKLLAKDDTLENIKKILSQIKIRRIIPKDSISLANFSLSPASVSIELTDNNLRSITFSQGIINPIDKSAYITFDNKDYIYQIDIPDISFHSFSLNDFIESNIFIFMPQKITRIKLSTVMKGGIKSTRFSIFKKDGKWFDGGKELSKDKVENFLEGLTLLKAIMILDEIPQDIQSTITRYFNPPQYNLEIEDENGLVISCDVSGIVNNSIDELKINKKENVLIKTSHRLHPYVVDKNLLNLLQVTGPNFMYSSKSPIPLTSESEVVPPPAPKHKKAHEAGHSAVKKEEPNI